MRVWGKDSRGGWGRNWSFLPGCGERLTGRRRIAGWLSPLPEKGDVFLSGMTSGMTGEFVAEAIKPCGDPPDMFFASVRFRGYCQSERADRVGG